MSGVGPGATLAAFAAVLFAVSAGFASAKSGRDAKHEHQYQAAGKPVMAIVSLSDQRISLYDTKGKMLEAPVSTGSAGYETPAGIFSIVQNKQTHHSNLYQDGEMPFMQRITWTGIALHAGALPGHPASHGCIRMPMAFAQHLFGITELGMRVLIVRDDMRPSDIAHPALFKSKPARQDLASVGLRRARLDGVPYTEIAPGSARHLQILQSTAAAKATELESAAKQDREARAAATRAGSEAAGAARLSRARRGNLAKAESALKAIERRLEKATSPQSKQQAETRKEKALAKLGALQDQLQSARLNEQAKREAAERAAEGAKAAAVARDSAARAAEEAARKTLPVSVFISRKTQRLYVRMGNYPIYEGPVTIRDAHMPIGTFVFTALDHLGTSGEMRWNVVSMYRNPTNIEPAAHGQPRRASGRKAPAAPTDVAAASAALERVVFAREALDVITEVVLPGSSLIFSDEGPSRETGKDTDFVVVMSGEPQGALKIRRREPAPIDAFGRSPFDGFGRRSPFDSSRRSPFRGLPFFWN